MTTVALLPMKANSERVPNKNFKNFAGKPLFRWILDSLLNCSEIDLVCINTDARDILIGNGLIETDRVIIRDRKTQLCGDHVSMNLIIKDDIEAIEAERYLMTHTTSPLVASNTIKRALNVYDNSINDGKFDSLFGVTKFQTRFYKSDSSPVNHDPKNLIRTQDLEPWYEENSSLYLFSKQSFSSTDARIGANPFLFEIPKLESIDIDDIEDWYLAEALASRKKMEPENA